MQKKIAQFLFSTRLTAVLFIVFAVAMAVGTILDRNMETSPTPYTRNFIYNAWWFETIMVFFVINFVGNIFRFKLWRKEKWATLTLHLSFIFILVGAFVTRYICYEGMMSIREGATENQFLSTETYISGRIIGDYEINGQLQQRNFSSKVDFSPRLENSFSDTYNYGSAEVNVELVKFIGGAELDIVPAEEGESYLKIVEAGDGRPHNHFLKEGEVSSLNNVLISLNNPVDGAINITNTEDGIFIQSPYEGEYMTMATMATGPVIKDSLQRLQLRSRYVLAGMQLVFPKPVVKGTFELVKKSQILKNDEDGVQLRISANGEQKLVNLVGGQGTFNGFEDVEVGGLDVSIQYGSKVLELPFEIKLNDFIAERYPGTEQGYSSYESKITVLDPAEGDFDYHIYMNNVLDHKGYRFFQASFDPDELGTILSVNHDKWGTIITYLGYMLLYFGLLAIMFARHTRFDELRKQLVKLKKKKAKLSTAALLLGALSGFSQQNTNHSNGLDLRLAESQIDSILAKNITPKEHSDKFGELVIQDYSGRMMPVNTFASEVLRKLTKSDTYSSYDATQVLLSIQESPQLWYNVPMIYMKPKKADSIRSLIGVAKVEKYARFVDFFTERGVYKLGPYLEEAYRAQVPNGFQKEFMEADKRVSLLYNILDGAALKLFPLPEDENNKWISSTDYKRQELKGQIADSLYGNFINNGLSAYLFTLNQAKQSGDFKLAENLINGIKDSQKKYGAEVMLSDEKIKTEILYNRYDIFKKLFSWYLYAGTILFILLIVQIFKDQSKGINLSVKVFKGIVVFLFALHTGGLIVRWYLSGHAPWSDAYESMIYVAWATMLFGLLFGRKSSLTLASTTFVTAMILMVAHWNWMDPAIANLQPVLNSYWLMIHVAVIVASYGPFALGMILGVVALFLMIFTTASNQK
ncbi:MAG: cytochrome c biogenesis protein ResB, partial [Bacteroidota bacterium]